MNKKESLIIYIIFVLVFVISAIYNFIVKSQWFFDNIFAMLLLTAVFFLAEWFEIGKKEFILLNFALVVHNLGAFGFYNLNKGIFNYDTLVHLLLSFITAYILFNFFVQKLHIRKHKRVRFSIIDEHKVIIIFLVISSVIMLGTIVEIVEFFGFMYLGNGEGMFFTGAGDVDLTKDDIASQYKDTMEDILTNILGSTLGVLIYYFASYRKRLQYL